LLARMGRTLAMRAALSRWGPEAAEELSLRNDPDIQTALTYFPSIPKLMKASLSGK
jgi:hypothetical protein